MFCVIIAIISVSREIKATGGIFSYNNRLFRQVDGVSMGSPLGPTLANFFMAHQEIKLLNSSVPDLPVFYCRYIDDIFCIFKHGTDHRIFFDHLNCSHPSLKFTLEHGKGSLAFLDAHISLPTVDFDSHCAIDVFRKQTYTRVILNFAATCPMNWKIGLIFCFLHRAYNICSSWCLLDKEFKYLEKLFFDNGYPVHVFQQCVRKFLSAKFIPQLITPKDFQFKNVIHIPYVGKSSILFKRRLEKLFKNYGISVTCVFTSFKTGRYFRLKDLTPHPLLPRVVYKDTCLCDINKSYIGKTKRHLVTRVDERLKGESAISVHLDNCATCSQGFGVNNFSIIDKGNSDFECLIKEAISIKNCNPVLNGYLYSGKCFQLKVF